MGEVQESHHTVGQVWENASGFKMNKAEGLLLGTYSVLSVVWLRQSLMAILKTGNKLQYQDMAIPNYFEALREQDLEELIEEE